MNIFKLYISDAVIQFKLNHLIVNIKEYIIYFIMIYFEIKNIYNYLNILLFF